MTLRPGSPSLMPPRELLTSQRIGALWHAVYPSAERTLCGLAKQPSLPGRKWPPTCPVCAETARAFDEIDGSCPPHWGRDRMREAGMSDDRLVDPPAQQPQLTPRQQAALDYLAAHDGVTADEVGAHLHERRGKAS